VTQKHPYRAILTPANIVTMARIVFIPVFIFVLLAPWPSWFPDPEPAHWVKPWVAAAVFALLALTDGVDGYLARSRNEITTLGKFLDPIADKILVAAALLALIELGELPAWVVLVILAREFLVSGLRMVVSSEGVVIAASWLGKVKTVFQIIAVILFIIKGSSAIVDAGNPIYEAFYVVSWTVMGIALLLTLLSLADYFLKSSAVLGLPLKPANAFAPALPSSPCLSPSPCDDLGSLASQVIERAQRAGVSLGTAESCTGGLVAAAITQTAGSSAVFKGAVVSYANEVKTVRLGVPVEMLAEYGAVSEPVALRMALGACAALDASLAVSVTGIAGPGGGSAEKPVGTVWMGLARDGNAQARLLHLTGTRAQIRLAATQAALTLLLDSLQD
jgi:CDP-diacylglycerol--glycerol-3-phosphate 3-phosphatidyltransferase